MEKVSPCLSLAFCLFCLAINLFDNLSAPDEGEFIRVETVSRTENSKHIFPRGELLDISMKKLISIASSVFDKITCLMPKSTTNRISVFFNKVSIVSSRIRPLYILLLAIEHNKFINKNQNETSSFRLVRRLVMRCENRNANQITTCSFVVCPNKLARLTYPN